ncbi:MAG: cation:dicarboxylate symporter family transporter, partial [Steroidobacteraceae bacterium]
MAQSDNKLANRILLGLAIGAAAAVATLVLANFIPGLLDGARWVSVNVFDPLGQVFLRMLFFVVIPLIFSSLAGGVVQLGELGRLGPLAARTFT